MARGTDIPPVDLMVVDPNTMVNNGTKIPKDPVVIAASHGTSVASDMLQKTSTAGALRVLTQLSIDGPLEVRYLLVFNDYFLWAHLHHQRLKHRGTRSSLRIAIAKQHRLHHSQVWVSMFSALRMLMSKEPI